MPTNFMCKPTVPAAAGVLLVCALHSAEVASPPGPPTARQDAPPRLEAEAQVDNLVRYAMRTREHALLNPMAGQWETLTRYWTGPEAEPVEAKGSSTRKWILDGRFLQEEFEGGNLALPFRAVGLYGYDAFDQQYTAMWVDSMNTAMLSNAGTYDPSNKVVRFTGRYGDPWTGKKYPSRGATRLLDNDKHVMEFYVNLGEREFKMLEITYTRRKTGQAERKGE
jgi:hypothetical protein